MAIGSDTPQKENNKKGGRSRKDRDDTLPSLEEKPRTRNRRADDRGRTKTILTRTSRKDREHDAIGTIRRNRQHQSRIRKSRGTQGNPRTWEEPRQQIRWNMRASNITRRYKANQLESGKPKEYCNIQERKWGRIHTMYTKLKADATLHTKDDVRNAQR